MWNNCISSILLEVSKLFALVNPQPGETGGDKRFCMEVMASMPTSSRPLTEETFREPLNAAQIMSNFPYAWCICGGWAIDLFVQGVSRFHKDVDIAIWRRDQLALHSYLVAKGWILEKAFEGQLFPWLEGEVLELPIHNVWCRNFNTNPSFIEVLFNEVDDRYFRFRRAFSIMHPLECAIVQSKIGIPILAPEIVLLYKAKNASDDGNQHDFDVALPHLEDVRRTWLRNALMELHPKHQWLDKL
jgi:hypothetical protein